MPVEPNLNPSTLDSQKHLIFPERISRNESKTENSQFLDKNFLPPDHGGVLGKNLLWRRIPPAEKCELCGQFAVEYEVSDVESRQILRRCQSCFDRMRRTFHG